MHISDYLYEPDPDDDPKHWPMLGAQMLADALLRTLPDDVPKPKRTVLRGGFIELSWCRKPARTLSVRIGSDNPLTYTWRDGSDFGEGSVTFDGDTIPRWLLDHIKRMRY